MRSLRRLLAPKTLAIVGGGAWGASILGAAQRVGFAGEITLVHPGGKVLEGARSVRSLAEIEGPIDAAFIAVNRHATIDIVAELAALGAGGATCFASGFSEALAEDDIGADLQARLVAAAGDMPILGPNCYGFVNALDGAAIWPDQHGMVRVDRGVAILTQSSNIAINLTQQARALPIGYMVACGNQAQTSQAQIASTLLDDDRVSVIGLHIEGFGDIAAWDRFARKAQARGVPVVALKVGLSEQAQQATVSHTASLAGSAAGSGALLERLGIAQVGDLPSFLETLKLLHVCGRLASNRISSISCSGGEASLAADMASGFDLEFPALTPDQKRDLRAALGPMVALANPLDYHTYVWRDPVAMAAAWAPMAADHIGLTFSIVDYPRTDASDWECATQAALAVRAKTGRPFAVVASLPELLPEDVAMRLLDGGVVPICGLREMIVAAEIAAQVPDLEPEMPLPASLGPGDAVLLDERQAKQALAAYGVPVPLALEVTRDGAWDASDLSAPFAVKGMGLAHKSEAGAVRLGISQAALKDAVSAMPTSSVLIEEMITGGVVELLIGVTRDPAHGFVLTIGAGGVLTEILRDTGSLLVPSSRARIRDVLHGLRIAPILAGYRGKPAVNIEAVLDAIMAVQKYVMDHADTLEEVEINPLIATPERAVAADALIRKGI